MNLSRIRYRTHGTLLCRGGLSEGYQAVHDSRDCDILERAAATALESPPQTSGARQTPAPDASIPRPLRLQSLYHKWGMPHLPGQSCRADEPPVCNLQQAPGTLSRSESYEAGVSVSYADDSHLTLVDARRHGGPD